MSNLINNPVGQNNINAIDDQNNAGSVQNAGSKLFEGHEVSKAQAEPRFSAGQITGIVLCVGIPVIGWLTGAILYLAGVFEKKAPQQAQAAQNNAPMQAEKKMTLAECKNKLIEVQCEIINIEHADDLLDSNFSPALGKDKDDLVDELINLKHERNKIYDRMNELGIEKPESYRFGDAELASYKKGLMAKYMSAAYKNDDATCKDMLNKIESLAIFGLDEDRNEIIPSVQKDIDLLNSIFTNGLSQNEMNEVQQFAAYNYHGAHKETAAKLGNILNNNDRDTAINGLMAMLAGKEGKALREVLSDYRPYTLGLLNDGLNGHFDTIKNYIAENNIHQVLHNVNLALKCIDVPIGNFDSTEEERIHGFLDRIPELKEYLAQNKDKALANLDAFQGFNQEYKEAFADVVNSYGVK